MYSNSSKIPFTTKGKICRKQFLETSDWFTAYNKGKVFIFWWVGLTSHKARYRKKFTSKNNPTLGVKGILLLTVHSHKNVVHEVMLMFIEELFNFVKYHGIRIHIRSESLQVYFNRFMYLN